MPARGGIGRRYELVKDYLAAADKNLTEIGQISMQGANPCRSGL